MLVDALRYGDETALHLPAQAWSTGGGGRPCRLCGPAAGAQAPAGSVALVRAAGLITRGGGSLVDGIAADELAGVLAGIADDPQLKAVVLRLDSGGGSAVASETIRHAVQQRARQRASRSWSRWAARRHPAPTGSRWPRTTSWRSPARSRARSASSPASPTWPGLAQARRQLGRDHPRRQCRHLVDQQALHRRTAKARVDDLVGWLYDRFTDLVAKGRDLSPERAQEVAKGRVWAGATALELGLVDELGGLDVALAAVRRALQLPPDSPLDVQVRPEAGAPALRCSTCSDQVGSLGAHARGSMAGDGTAAVLPISIR